MTTPSLLTRAEPVVRRGIRPALWLLVLLPAVALVAQLLLDQLGADPIEALEHASGKWALRLLAASLAVTRTPPSTVPSRRRSAHVVAGGGVSLPTMSTP